MKKNFFNLFAIAALAVSTLIAGCNGCSKSDQEAWDRFLKHAKECADKKDAFMANCKAQKEADAWAELQACKNACPFDIGACNLNPNCIIEKLNERIRCMNACEERYRQRILSNIECENKWNDAFWECLNKKP
ncbi:MAG TPA: hypothetical protein VK483_09000 [Chitinophagaceae bacterium]|nr:hypothetical protein [Chitinophagaceae bacterium]